MSEHLVYGFNGSQVLCECREGGWLTRQEFAAHTRAEALVPVLALADRWADEAGNDRDIESRTLRVVAAALRAAAGTPTHHTTEEETT